MGSVAFACLLGACGGKTTNDLFASGGAAGTGSGASGGSGGSAGASGGSGGASGGSGGAAGGSGGATGGSGGATGGSGGATGGSAGTGGSGGCANPEPEKDYDADGFTAAQGDCDECAAGTNPGAFDTPGDGVDQDCSGKADDEPADCDAAISGIDESDPLQAAYAIGLCRKQKGRSWGVVKASYVKADGTTGMAAASHGLLPDFGPNVSVREGKRLLALSSGTARRPNDPGYQDPQGADMATTSAPPTGFSPPNFFCPTTAPAPAAQVNDPAALDLVVRVPTNMQSFSVDFDFHSYEFPTYVCSQYNDSFALLQAPAPGVTVGGSIAFDNNKDAISVNNRLIGVCSPQTAGGVDFKCPSGDTALAGTGFEGHAATGWLTTHSPVKPGSEVTLRFAIWDAGDHVLDSTVLVDNFRWHADPVGAPSTSPAQ